MTGTGFISSSVVNFNNAAISTTYVSATSVTATVPAAAIAADGTATVTATNPSPGGGTSAAEKYTIAVPTPVVTSLSPANVAQATAATITITGTGFEANSVAQWNGTAKPTTFVNGTTLQMALSASDTLNTVQSAVTVANPGLPATTPVNLAIIASTPVITSISPNSVAAYTGSASTQQIYIQGTGFLGNATVQANGQQIPVVSVSSTYITASLAASYFATPGTISIVVSNQGVPVVSSNAATLTVTSASTAPSFTMSPNAAPAGSPDTTITISGGNFYPDSVVSWNNTPLVTTYVNSYSVTAVIPAADLAGFVQASVSVSTPEDSAQPQPQLFDTYLALSVNDIVYNPNDGLIYASIPGSMAGGIGNTIAKIDPTTGVIVNSVFVGSNPNRLALSSDGTQLFVGLDGAGAVAQVNLATFTTTGQFSLGSGTNGNGAPYTAISLAAVPGQSNSVAIYNSNEVVTIYDSGVARTNNSSGFPIYVGNGAIAFGASASTLYLTANGSNLYQLTIGSTGVTAATQLGTGPGGSTLQYDNGLLYVPQGIVFNASTGDQAGQFSISTSYSTTPIPATGPVISDSTLNLAWILSNSGPTGYSVLSFNETTYDPVESLDLAGVGTAAGSNNTTPTDLIRWGQDGLAFHTPNQLYVLSGPIVKDNSGSPADVAVSVQAPASGTTGSALTYTVNVTNNGPNSADGVDVTITAPASAIIGTITPSQGSCSGTTVIYCDLDTIANSGTASITVSMTPTTAGTIETTALLSSISYDPVSTNNQSSASSTITGSSYNAAPLVTQLSPMLIQAGSNAFTITVDGEGFNDNSTIMWNGQSLQTTYLSSGQLTASVEASLITQIGWAPISVSNPAPGGGQSNALPLSIYQILNVPANAIAYDPYTEKLYAVLPSTSPTISGNSIVAIDPATGNIGTPVQVGSEPNLLSETSDGNYMYIGLSGAKSLGQFNLLTQTLNSTIPLPSNQSNVSGQNVAVAIAAVPGTDTSLAVEEQSYGGIGILDISGITGDFRQNSSSYYAGSYPVFVDPTHFYAYNSSTGAGAFYQYSISSSGVTQIDSTTLNGLGGFGGPLATDGGLVYGAGGGIINPSTTPPSQVALLPLPAGTYGNTDAGAGAVPYAAEAKSFNVAIDEVGNDSTYLERFDTQHFILEDQIPFPANVSAAVPGTRWGQDGLAYLLPPSPSYFSSPTPAQIFLIRGPFVLPAEAVSNAAPTLSATGSTTTVGNGNQIITINGSGFLPGATVFWGSTPLTTTYVNAGQVTAALGASTVGTGSSVQVTVQNPGSAASNTLTVSVQ